MEKRIIDAAHSRIGGEMAKVLTDYAADYGATHICAAHEAAKPLADACAALGAKTLFRRDAPPARAAVAPYEGCLPSDWGAVLVIGHEQQAINMVDLELRLAGRSVTACALANMEEGLAHIQTRISHSARKIKLVDPPR